MSYFSQKIDKTKAERIRELVGVKQPSVAAVCEAASLMGYDFSGMHYMANDYGFQFGGWAEKLIRRCSEDALASRRVWVVRELLRFICGYYYAPYTLYDVQGHLTHAALVPWFVHTSRDDPGMLAYTPTDEYGAADRQVKMRPEALLRKLLPAITDVEIRDLVGELRAEYDPSFLVASTYEEVLDVYTNMAGDTGCMRRQPDYFGQDVHPSAVYAAPELGLSVAYLRDAQNRVNARCVIYTSPDGKDKRMVRTYGSLLLERKLQKAGYEYKSLQGLYLPAIPAGRAGRANCYAMPYLDAPRGERRDDNMVGVTPVTVDGERRFLVEPHDCADYGANSTGGHVYVNNSEFVSIDNMFVICGLTGGNLRRSKADRVILHDGSVVWLPRTHVDNSRSYLAIAHTTEGMVFVRKWMPGDGDVETVRLHTLDWPSGVMVPAVADMSIYGDIKELHPAYASGATKAYATADCSLTTAEKDGTTGLFLTEHVAYMLTNVKFEYDDAERTVTYVHEGEVVAFGPDGSPPRASSKRVTLDVSMAIRYAKLYNGLDKYGKVLTPTGSPWARRAATGTYHLVDPDRLDVFGVVTRLDGTQGFGFESTHTFNSCGVSLYAPIGTNMTRMAWNATDSERAAMAEHIVAAVTKRLSPLSEYDRDALTDGIIRELAYRVASNAIAPLRGWNSDTRSRVRSLMQINKEVTPQSGETETRDYRATSLFLDVVRKIKPELMEEQTEQATTQP